MRERGGGRESKGERGGGGREGEREFQSQVPQQADRLLW